VPVGTLVFDEEGEGLLADLKKPGQRILVAREEKAGAATALCEALHQAPVRRKKGNQAKSAGYGWS